ncbi:helix-turn-helix transcriptional regulator [Arsukibacterium tuosuense]|uniref:helix-turn-helix transcriptional regulator n=1 Tax=Arsukibacterium tuosuense TaxID=1323745 RepID=UPI0014825925|nr:WYL domain-containing protein [Arsukibacterium tuosuense]
MEQLGGLCANTSAEGNTWYKITANNREAMQPSEAFMLLLSEKLLVQTMPAEYARRLEERLVKAKSILSAENSFNQWDAKLQVISDGYPLINCNNIFSEELREVIYDGVLREHQIEISYQARGKENAVSYKLNPLGIIIRGQSHYLVATQVTASETPLLFLFHRIKNAYSLYSGIEKPRSFTLQQYYAKNPSGWILKNENQFETIELKVKDFALDTLTHNKLAEDQLLDNINDGWATVRFNSVPTYDLVAWILRYGADVICVSPEHLRSRVKKSLIASLALYQ